METEQQRNKRIGNGVFFGLIGMLLIMFLLVIFHH
jgi:hypothetical protein